VPVGLVVSPAAEDSPDSEGPVLAAIGICPLAAAVMTEGERSLGSFPPWESPQMSLPAPALSTRYLMPVHDIDCSNLTLVQRGARTDRGYLLCFEVARVRVRLG
jgi:hypothetical protein